jgi:hypothetical protein
MSSYSRQTSGLLVPAQAQLGAPRVVHCKREPHHVYIGRNPRRMAPSKWGNRFVVGVHGQRGECIALHKRELRERGQREFDLLMAELDELRGRVLGCWCAPRACHGDVLVSLANASVLERERWFALAA